MTGRLHFVLVAAAVLTVTAPRTGWCQAAPAATLTVTPSAATVRHVRFPQTLVVTRKTSDGITTDLTREARFASANSAVATVDERGRVFPVASGETTITVTVAGQSLPVAISSQPSAPAAPANSPISYQDEVQPILSKHRCNQGACHGYSLGKNGFKLSLRGADAVYDHFSVTKEFYGRRIDGSNPEASLLLTKPVGDVPHVGGVRFGRKHDSYIRLAQWVREGAPSDLGKVPELQSISVVPEAVVLPKPGSSMQLQVTAKFSDGTTRDVTPLTIFTSNAEEYAEVNDDGLVTMRNRGEAAITVRYERMFVVSNLICLDETPAFTWSNPPERNLVDANVFSKLRDLRVNPSDVCSDEEFVRRVYLDLIGVQPTSDEVRAFLADTSSADKRDRLIESLFTRPEFVDRWSLKWGDLLQSSRKFMTEESMFAFRDWLRHAVASNMPLDRMAREVLTGEGNPRDNATAAFYRVSASDPKVSMERAAQVFTGIRMLCARCHPHPFENWTQADYYGMTTFFNQVAEKPDVNDPLDRLIVVRHETPFAVNPRTNQLQPPRTLGGKDLTLDPNVDRREIFAAWLTTKENPFFARSMTNRLWSYFFSRGIIDPVDDLRVTNPPINAKLLDALTKDFVDHNFDARHLMRTIVQSRTYQLSSRPNESNKRELANFSHALPRRMSAEQLYDSVEVATGVRETVPGAPAGFRAAQGPDTNVTSEFLDLFGRAQRMEACECERTTDSNMLQALHMINGDTLLKRVTNPTSRVTTLVKNDKLTPEQKVEEVYVSILCRRPTEQELKVSLEHLKKYEQPLEGFQDLAWALLNSSDFLFVQ